MIMFSWKSHGIVGETHHFRKPPYIFYLVVFTINVCQMKVYIPVPWRLFFGRFLPADLTGVLLPNFPQQNSSQKAKQQNPSFFSISEDCSCVELHILRLKCTEMFVFEAPLLSNGIIFLRNWDKTKHNLWIHLSYEKNLPTFHLVNSDPYIGLLKSPYNWVV